MDIEQFRQACEQKFNICLEVQPGKRYTRLVEHNGPGLGSAWAFIEKTSGDILKPSSWKSPAKHARGNLNDANPLAHCSEYGPHYLR